MEKKAKTEQHLSEEQLQAITGGCDQCMRNQAHINYLQSRAEEYDKFATLALQAVDRSTTMEELDSHQLSLYNHQHEAAKLRQEAYTIGQEMNSRHANILESSRPPIR
jgi:hypothetical protein